MLRVCRDHQTIKAIHCECAVVSRSRQTERYRPRSSERFSGVFLWQRHGWPSLCQECSLVPKVSAVTLPPPSLLRPACVNGARSVTADPVAGIFVRDDRLRGSGEIPCRRSSHYVLLSVIVNGPTHISYSHDGVDSRCLCRGTRVVLSQYRSGSHTSRSSRPREPQTWHRTRVGVERNSQAHPAIPWHRSIN